VRIPVGLMFAVMGVLLAGYGLFGDQSGYAKSLGINVDLVWGLVMICVSACLLGLAWSSRDRSA
jgi:ABC-type Fe3+-siderophore transport system permease subunit